MIVEARIQLGVIKEVMKGLRRWIVEQRFKDKDFGKQALASQDFSCVRARNVCYFQILSRVAVKKLAVCRAKIRYGMRCPSKVDFVNAGSQVQLDKVAQGHLSCRCCQQCEQVNLGSGTLPPKGKLPGGIDVEQIFRQFAQASLLQLLECESIQEWFFIKGQRHLG